MNPETMHIGLDDTDSSIRGCTTYVAALLVEELEGLGAKFIDYPNLVRLNPNVPWKTRGNGAICLRISFSSADEEGIKEAVIDTVEKQSDLSSDGTDPGIVFFRKATIPTEIRQFARRATSEIMYLQSALSILERHKAEAIGFKDSRGLIGALAAVGEILESDHTFELIAYRLHENRGLKRLVDRDSIIKMDKATSPYTFNNVDPDTGRVIITPRGPDPILLGVRGETAEIVRKAFQMLIPLEPIERWVIFRTNQGTDAHLRRLKSLGHVKPYCSVTAEGTVSGNPKIVPRRHIIFSIKDQDREIDCAAYEPTGTLRKTAGKLRTGDLVEVCGGVRPPGSNYPLTINLEKIKLLKLAPKIVFRNPVCPECARSLESMGKEKGFRCRKCGALHRGLQRLALEVSRDTEEGLYITSPRSQRHLTKPSKRYGMEKQTKPEEPIAELWHYP